MNEEKKTVETENKKTSKKIVIRGSGYTFDENIEPSDGARSVNKSERTDIVTLPSLGQKNRP